MPLLSLDDVVPLLRCPRCRSALHQSADRFTCESPECAFSGARSFRWAACWPVLIDFDASVFDEELLLASSGKSLIGRPRDRKFSLRALAQRLIYGSNPVSERNARKLVALARERNPHPTFLVIGGGTLGPGEAYLHACPDLRLIACDVYGSPNVQFIADGHRLPLEDSSVDAVWIEAVLEHVLEPSVVVAEIRRVLKLGGLVYADTPFLQHVHEGAYDFTRYTESGHRWLFRDFERIDSGTTLGPGTVLSWSIGAAATALFRSWKLGKLVRIAFFWVRFIDRVAPTAQAIDTASAFYFLGRKTGSPLGYKDAIREYRGSGKF